MRRAFRWAACWCATAALFALFAQRPAFSAEQAAGLDETKAVLTEIYHDEVRAYSAYRIYAEKAEAEGYLKIAALFRAITVSEVIHARNMKHLLEGLGEEVTEEEFTVEVSTTRKNLKRAMDVEFSEISETYPAYIERITVEGYRPAIEAVNYSWNSERQHRDNIKKIRDAVGFFFGTVAKKIESAPGAYHVCTVCGSTVRELPRDSCSVCKGPVSLSVKVPGDDFPLME